MNRLHIEKEARRLQYEIWHKRHLLFRTSDQLATTAMYDPAIAARVLDLKYEYHDELPAAKKGVQAAGTLDAHAGHVAISTKYERLVQRFTGAHVIGHCMLHGMERKRKYRDHPIYRIETDDRPPIEQEADFFAACFLAPRGLLTDAFAQRFGERMPLRLDERVASMLKGKFADKLLAGKSAPIDFASAVASTRKFGRRPFKPLAEEFHMSVSAMAYRLRQLGLVADGEECARPSASQQTRPTTKIAPPFGGVLHSFLLRPAVR